MSKIELMDGKYTIVNELEEGGGFRALRYGEEWRNIVGDNLILSMFYRIEDQAEEIAKLRRKLEYSDEMVELAIDAIDIDNTDEVRETLIKYINGGDDE